MSNSKPATPLTAREGAAAAARSSRQGSVAAHKPKFDVPCLVYIDLAGDSRERCLVTALARHSGD